MNHCKVGSGQQLKKKKKKKTSSGKVSENSKINLPPLCVIYQSYVYVILQRAMYVFFRPVKHRPLRVHVTWAIFVTKLMNTRKKKK